MTRFLFWIERPLHIPILKPLWTYVVAQKLGEVAFATFCEPKDGLGLDGVTIQGLEKSGLSYAIDPKAYGPDITFLADHNYHYVEGLSRLVNVGHGTISKGLYFMGGGVSRRENLADLLCVPGQAHKAMLRRAVHKRIQVCGMPKLDACFSTLANRDLLLTHWGLDPSRKTLLFAPTFNEELSLLPHLKKPLRDYIPSDWNVIVKLHGATAREIRDRLFENAKKDSSIFIASGEDVSEFFPAVDMLLSDLSSVIYEFAALDKPILIFDSPWQKRYVHYSRNHLEYRHRGIGLRFSEVDMLPVLIAGALARHSDFLPKQQKHSRQMLSIRDGTSAQRVVDAALKLLDQKSDLTLVSGSQDDLDKALLTLETSFVFFCREGFSLSSHGVETLVNHLRKNSKVSVVSPMILESPSLNDAELKNFGIQLGYALPGDHMALKNQSPLCFAARAAHLRLLPRTRKKGSFLLALDAVLFPATAHVEKSSPLISPSSKYSILDSFISQRFQNAPRNFLPQVFKKIRQGGKPWTPEKEVLFLNNLGSAFEKVGDWKEALFYLKKAKRLMRNPERSVEARLFFHLGYCHHQLKNYSSAKPCFKRCLELEPEHRSAKELMNA